MFMHVYWKKLLLIEFSHEIKAGVKKKNTGLPLSKGRTYHLLALLLRMCNFMLSMATCAAQSIYNIASLLFSVFSINPAKICLLYTSDAADE